MTAYYNEWEPHPAQWLRNLIKAGLIAPGEVDERSITDVKAEDLKGYTQCHFFAGIGGWSYALRLAGWPDDRPVWTGSCPCQPFSSDGSGKAQSDERHLSPTWLRLIAECHPSTVFGEQVEDAVAYGWIDDLCCHLEKEDYSCAATVLPAYSANKPHERNRIFFVSDSNKKRLQGRIADGAPIRTQTFIETTSWWDIPPPYVCGAADGISGRMGQLCAYGNAIVPQLAAEFIKAFLECQP